jgi:hypothetical protein
MATAKLITYDLLAPNQDYSDLIHTIENYDYVKITESCFVVETNESPKQIKDNLSKFLDKNDRIFVTNLKSGSSWRNMIGDSEKYKGMNKE